MIFDYDSDTWYTGGAATTSRNSEKKTLLPLNWCEMWWWVVVSSKYSSSDKITKHWICIFVLFLLSIILFLRKRPHNPKDGAPQSSMELLSESILLHLQFCYKWPSKTNIIRIRCDLQWHLKFEKTPNRTQNNRNGITEYLHSRRFWTTFKCATYIIACCLKNVGFASVWSKSRCWSATQND